MLFKEQSDYTKALDYYDQAMAIYSRVNDEDGIGDCYTNMGVAYKSLGQYDEALAYYALAIDIQLVHVDTTEFRCAGRIA